MNPKIKSLFWLLSKMLLAAGIISWLVYKNYDDLSTAVLKISPPWLIAAAILYGIHMCAGAWRWQILLKVQKINLSFYEALSLTLQGVFFSLVIPGGAIGGDFAKAGFNASRTRKGEKLKGIFTILIDRVIGMIALFSLAGVVGAMSFSFLRSLSGYMEIILYALIAGCFLGLISAAALFLHRTLEKISLVKWILDHVDRLSKGALHNLMDAMDEFKSSYRSLIFCFIISLFLVHLLLAVVVYLIGHGSGADNLTYPFSILATSMANTVGALPITPSGVGTRDYVMMKLLDAKGITEQSTLIPLTFTAIFLTYSLIGGLIFAISRKHKKDDSGQMAEDR